MLRTVFLLPCILIDQSAWRRQSINDLPEIIFLYVMCYPWSWEATTIQHSIFSITVGCTWAYLHVLASNLTWRQPAIHSQPHMFPLALQSSLHLHIHIKRQDHLLPSVPLYKSILQAIFNIQRKYKFFHAWLSALTWQWYSFVEGKSKHD